MRKIETETLVLDAAIARLALIKARETLEEEGHTKEAADLHRAIDGLNIRQLGALSFFIRAAL